MAPHLIPSTGDVTAFIDLGTNSVRLLVVRVNPNQSYTILRREKEFARLGEGEFQDQYLKEEAMGRAIAICGRFRALALSYGAAEIHAVATSATRDALNRNEFLERLRNEAGLDVRVVSGKEEARLIYLGVSSGEHLAGHNCLFIDIGGGSTEVIVGGQDEYGYLDSMRLGAIRLTSLFFLPGEAGSVAPERYALICQHVRNASVRTVQALKEEEVDLAYGSSGTILNLAEIAARGHFGESGPEGVLLLDQLRAVIKHLCSLDLEHRRKVSGINPERADIIVAGAAILETLMESLGLDGILTSDRGLQHGLLMDHLAKGSPELVEGLSVRERSVLQISRACGFDEPHARHVSSLAVALFDSGREVGLHHYGEEEAELLKFSAMMHDIGMFLSFANHEAHTYYLIRNAELLGFDQKEIAIMATTAFFHRKKAPRKRHAEFSELDKPSRNLVSVLSMFLRLAESLDRSHIMAVRAARFDRDGEKGRVLLKLTCFGDCQLELWQLEAHREAFRKTFNRELEFLPVPEPRERAARS